jgi:hypothetical protein
LAEQFATLTDLALDCIREILAATIDPEKAVTSPPAMRLAAMQLDTARRLLVIQAKVKAASYRDRTRPHAEMRQL